MNVDGGQTTVMQMQSAATLLEVSDVFAGKVLWVMELLSAKVH